jgi:hypothetical protein
MSHDIVDSYYKNVSLATIDIRACDIMAVDMPPPHLLDK